MIYFAFLQTIILLVPPGMSPENLKKIAHLELQISKINLISVRKWGNEQTDRHTRFLELFGTSVGTSQECLQKIWERYLFQNWRYKAYCQLLLGIYLSPAQSCGQVTEYWPEAQPRSNILSQLSLVQLLVFTKVP